METSTSGFGTNANPFTKHRKLESPALAGALLASIQFHAIGGRFSPTPASGPFMVPPLSIHYPPPSAAQAPPPHLPTPPRRLSPPHPCRSLRRPRPLPSL